MLRCSTTCVLLRGRGRVTNRRVESIHARASRARNVTVAALSPCAAAIAMIDAGTHIDRERTIGKSVAGDHPRLRRGQRIRGLLQLLRLLRAERDRSEEKQHDGNRGARHPSDYTITAFRSALRAARA